MCLFPCGSTAQYPWTEYDAFTAKYTPLPMAVPVDSQNTRV